MNLKSFWPWKTIARLSAELVEKDSQIARLQKEVGLFRNLNQTKLQEVQDAVNMKSENIEQLSLEVKRLEKQVEEKDQAMRKLGVILAMSKGIAVLFMLCCVTAVAQPVVRSPLTTNLLSIAPADGWFVGSSNGVPVWFINGGLLTNIQGSSIVGAITGMVFIATDTAAHIDALTPGLAELLWAYDGNRETIGDGATPGGIPLAIRYWLSDTNTLTAGGRMGELAVAQSGITLSPSTNPAIYLNAAPGTNWVPIIQLDASNGMANVFGTAASVIDIHVANTNPIVSGGAVSGNPGTWNSPLLALGPGNPGTGTTTGTTGNGGSPNPIRALGGDGGSVSTTGGGTGGQGGGGGSFSASGGKGGDANNGFFGGAGGGGGTMNFAGGNGSADTVSGNGPAGGSSGNIIINGANANSTTAGGSGGSFTANGASGASGGKSGGSYNAAPVSGATSRHGGNITTFGSSYAPMTIFTTTTSTGPNASSSETSLLGTAANLAPVSGQVQGKNIASNIVNHAGRTLKFAVTGEITNNTPSLQLKIKLGSTVILSTDSVALVTTANITNRWRLTGQVTFRTVGSSGTSFGEGFFEEFSTTAPVTSFATTNLATITIDTTTDQAVDCTATFNAATGQMIGDTAHFELVD